MKVRLLKPPYQIIERTSRRRPARFFVTRTGHGSAFRLNVWKRPDCGENDRTPHGIVRVWPKPGKIPLLQEACDRVKQSLSAFQRDYGSAVYLSNYSNRAVKSGNFNTFSPIFGQLVDAPQCEGSAKGM